MAAGKTDRRKINEQCKREPGYLCKNSGYSGFAMIAAERGGKEDAGKEYELFKH